LAPRANAQRYKLPAGITLPPRWTDNGAGPERRLKGFPYEYYAGLDHVALVAEQWPGDNVVVESSGCFYLWNQTSDEVYRVAEPTDVCELLKRLGAAPNWDWDIKFADVEELPGPPDHHVSIDYAALERILAGLRSK
jgi:hypothetical protein